MTTHRKHSGLKKPIVVFASTKGHIEKVCQKKGAANDKSSDKKEKPPRYVEEDASADELFKNWHRSPEPSIVIPVAITTTTTAKPATAEPNGHVICMEIETGAAVSVIWEETWKGKFPSSPLESS